ncbi:MAG: discoidin domain-containing protein, partial [Solirubrobacterales bacterium]
TYYWRVDEINAAPDYTIFKGPIWSFTVEPYSYPLAVAAATASSSQPNMGPENTINGSGLDANDQHNTNLTSMWMTPGGKPAWIQYEFDKVYKLDEMWVWNSNQAIESFLGFGAKTVVIEYSIDGETWTALEGVPEFAKATGMPTYTANTVVDFNGVLAKFVKLTIEANWGGLAQTGLSEVRFFYVPLHAFNPQPVVGATGVSVEARLDWRPGREAVSHRVFLGTDSSAVAAGTAASETLGGHGYAPAGLLLDTRYYWRVDEIGDPGTYAGDVWDFTTEAYAVVDDFEGYTDDVEAETTIWHAWIDGVTDGASGSQVGYTESPFAERTVVHAGSQAMPLFYNNTSFAFSEAKRTFDSPQDWTAHGVGKLTIYFAGAEGNAGQLYARINNAKIAYAGDPADLAKTDWHAWDIDLSAAGNVGSVRTLTIGVEGSGATGTLYIDDIRLSP